MNLNDACVGKVRTSVLPGGKKRRNNSFQFFTYGHWLKPSSHQSTIT